jgi:regulator of nucleoside diphosphate kinase
MKPAILVSWLDMDRLDRMLDAIPSLQVGARDALLDELGRAALAEPWEMPSDVVTMNSRVRFCFDSAEEEMTMTLTYPKDMAGKPDQLSILTPVGTALLGLAVGDTISWERPDGAMFALTVRGIEYQPERDGQYHR